jgi:hypothetical protein
MSENYEYFIVRSEGGLGAQIVAASAYFYLKSLGCKVLMDLSYFDYPFKEAEIGKPQVTHWDWKLDYYGLDKSNLDWISLNNLRNYTKDTKKDPNEGLEIFNLNEAITKFSQIEGKEFNEYSIHKAENNIKGFFKENPIVIHDGPNKNRLFINGMQKEEIKTKFTSISEEWKQIIKENKIDFTNSVILHLRRGDYLNVATHLISCEEILKMCKKLPKVLKNIIIFSDSKESDNQKFVADLKEIFYSVKWMDKVDNLNTHKIMTKANFLMCSNSQFSTTAAYLGKGFSIIPQKYSSDNDYVFQYENKQTSFALLNN